VCWATTLPSILFWSDSDLGPGTAGFYQCRRVDDPPPGASFTSWVGFWKLAKLISRFPW